MVSLWRKIVAGSDRNRSRLHDRAGRRIAAGRLLRNGPRALATGLLRLGLGRLPQLPWISYDASRALARRLGPEARVLEFGAGMSTAWYAAPHGEVVSIEDNPAWHSAVQARLTRIGGSNVRLRLTTDLEAYPLLTPEERGDGFDLVVIDGRVRHLCAQAAPALLRAGGCIYLDNADRDAPGPDSGDTPLARQILLAFAQATGARVEWFTDFAPAQLFVQAGLLVTLPARSKVLR